MTQPKTVLTAASDIRPYLNTLLGPETAQTVETQLQALLTQAESGQAVENQITEVLRHHQPTREWVRRYLRGENPEQITRSIRDSRLLGDPTLQPAIKYVCPINNHYTWYREDNSPIPLCPDHLIPLVLAQP